MKDESNDSFLARSDVLWSKLLSQKLSLADLQAFIMLRGSTLTPEEKKRVILEADNSLEGKLTVKKVSDAVRLLGATFFQEMTGTKSNAKTKVYSSETLLAEDNEGESALQVQDELCEDDFVECLLNEGDEDASLIADFEAAASDLVQEDSELASAFSAYQDARKRLSEKFRNRGFWSTSTRFSSQSTKGKGFSNKGGSKGKGSWSQRPKRSLQDRILNSVCRNCNRKGHWKAECPFRNSPSGGSSVPASTTGSMPTTTVTVESPADILPLEFLDLPSVQHEAIDATLPVLPVFVNVLTDNQWGHAYKTGLIHGESNSGDRYSQGSQSTARQRLKAWGFRNRQHCESPRREDPLSPMPLARSMQECENSFCSLPRHQKNVTNMPLMVDKSASQHLDTHPHAENVCFASHGSFGILDLGASKTVIGSENLAELIQSLDVDIRQKLSRCPCDITFKFGNQATLTSKQALVIPLGPLKLKVAIVSGGTPFLVSNTLMRTMAAKIDCSAQLLFSDMLRTPIKLHLTHKGLFLVDMNALIRSALDKKSAVCPGQLHGPAETFMSNETDAKHQPAKCVPKEVNTDQENLDHLTLTDLAEETIAFGQKYKGCQYQETWQDQEWIQFMISRYQSSSKPEHRRFLKYVELQIEALEQGQAPPSANQQGVIAPKAKAKVKAMAKSIATASVASSLPDGETDWDLEPEMYEPPTMSRLPMPQAEDVAALQQRMLNMEEALMRVIRHIEDQSQNTNVQHHAVEENW
eukprot:s1350_g14.t1